MRRAFRLFLCVGLTVWPLCARTQPASDTQASALGRSGASPSDIEQLVLSTRNVGIDRLWISARASDEAIRTEAYRSLAARRDSAAWEILDQVVRTQISLRSGREQLALVRALVPASCIPEATRLLTRLVALLASSDLTDAHRELAVRVDMLGLASSGLPEAYDTLDRALAGRGTESDAAGRALAAYPPHSLRRWLSRGRPRSPAWAKWLEVLHRPETIDALREALVDGNVELKLASGRALWALDDPQVLPVLRYWLTHSNIAPQLRRAAHDWLHPEVDLVAAQNRTLLAAPLDDFARVVERRLVGSFSLGATLRLITLRNLTRAAKADRYVSPRLRIPLSSREAGVRALAAAAWGSAHPSELPTLLDHPDQALRRGAASVLAYVGLAGKTAKAVAVVLDRSLQSRYPESTCGALVHPAVAESVALQSLLTLAEGQGPCASVASLALARRDPRQLRPVLRRLIETSSFSVRAGVASGLSDSPRPSATGLLMERYLAEADVRVRRAIVRSLLVRAGLLAQPTLVAASRFDPDPWIRLRAQEALEKYRNQEQSRSSCPLPKPAAPFQNCSTRSFACSRTSTVGSYRLPSVLAEARRHGQILLLIDPEGLALPALADDEDFLLVPREGASLTPWHAFIPRRDAQVGGAWLRRRTAVPGRSAQGPLRAAGGATPTSGL